MFSNSNCASVPLVANIDGNGNNGGWADGGWLWIIVVFALLFGWGNGGFGGFGGNNGGGYVATAATQADIQRGFDNSAVISKLDGISNGLCDGFYAMNNSMLIDDVEAQEKKAQEIIKNLADNGGTNNEV